MDLESTKLQLEDELEAKAELQKLLIRVQEEIRFAKDRFEKEIESKNEEIEDQRFDSFSFFQPTPLRSHLDVNSISALPKFKNN